MKQFLAQFTDSILCTLGCFDRLLFKGDLPISHPASMERWLAVRGILLKDFKEFVTTQSDRLKAHAQQLAATAGRPYQYLFRPIRKDDAARQIAERDGLTEGLICVFAILEPAQSFQLRYGEGRPRLVSTQPRCLCLYCYYLDRDFGLLAPPPPNLVSLHRPKLCQRPLVAGAPTDPARPRVQRLRQRRH